MNIREAKLDELNKVVGITNEAFNIPYQKEDFKLKYNEPPEALIEEFKKGETKVLVVEEDGQIIGAVRYKKASEKFVPHDINSVEISKLAVPFKYRNKGIGAQLMREVEKMVKNEGFDQVVLEAMLEKNLPQHYKKLGYEEYNTIKHEDHHDVSMFKRL